MTRYTVVWYPYPENEVLRLWLAAPDKQAISDAANEIDRELAVDAEIKGRFVRAPLRTFSVPPLRVLYRVSEPDRLVAILAVSRA